MVLAKFPTRPSRKFTQNQFRYFLLKCIVNRILLSFGEFMLRQNPPYRYSNVIILLAACKAQQRKTTQCKGSSIPVDAVSQENVLSIRMYFLKTKELRLPKLVLAKFPTRPSRVFKKSGFFYVFRFWHRLLVR